MTKEEINGINIIYHDENFNKFFEEIIKDYQYIKKETNATLILTKSTEEMNLLLNFISKTTPNCKSVLIMNGGSSEKLLSFLKGSSYMNLFVKGIIYCQNSQKYQIIMDKNKPFIDSICNDPDSVIKNIRSIFKEEKNNQKFECNEIINMNSYTDFYHRLHKEISNYYNKSQLININKLNPEFLKDIDNGRIIFFDKIYNFYNSFKNKNDKEFIFKYLYEENLSISLNQLLMKHEEIDFNYIGYFVGNLMNRIVLYGKTEGRDVVQKSQFYKGIQLDIINLFEFYKNEGIIISFSNFMMITQNKDIAILNSQRNIPLEDRKDKNLFSVIFNIQYSHDNGFEASIYDLSQLMPYPDEESFIILPFTFFYVEKITTDSKNMNADIDLLVIGKKEILEHKVKMGKKLTYDKKNGIIIPA